jgi:hypothetical protein
MRGLNQVCGKTRQNKWKTKGGAAMARRPVTLTTECRPCNRVEWNRVELRTNRSHIVHTASSIMEGERKRGRDRERIEVETV